MPMCWYGMVVAAVFDARWAVIKVEVANFCAAMDTLIDQDALMTAPLKVVSIECIEHEVTCLNERVFIKAMNHLLTNCSQSTLLAMICRLSLLVLNTS